MKQTIEDKLVSKVSKGKLNTIHVSREEMADLVDQHFIQNGFGFKCGDRRRVQTDLESHKKRNPF